MSKKPGDFPKSQNKLTSTAPRYRMNSAMRVVRTVIVFTYHFVFLKREAYQFANLESCFLAESSQTKSLFIK